MSYSRVGLLILSISVIPVKSLTFFRYQLLRRFRWLNNICPLKIALGLRYWVEKFLNYVPRHFLMLQNIPHLAIPIIRGDWKFPIAIFIIQEDQKFPKLLPRKSLRSPFPRQII